MPPRNTISTNKAASILCKRAEQWRNRADAMFNESNKSSSNSGYYELRAASEIYNGVARELDHLAAHILDSDIELP